MSPAAPPRATPVKGSRWRPPPTAAPLAVGALAVGVCVVLAVVDPEDRTLWTPRCPFRAATGLDCPGCGGTRAVAALVRGDLPAALSHNVLTVVLLPVLLWAWAGWLAFRAGRRPSRPELPTRAAWTLAVLVPLFAVLRNLPWGPLSWLASGAG
jgi:hypothetical protein